MEPVTILTPGGERPAKWSACRNELRVSWTCPDGFGRRHVAVRGPGETDEHLIERTRRMVAEQ